MTLWRPTLILAGVSFATLSLMLASPLCGQHELPANWKIRRLLVPESDIPTHTVGTLPMRSGEFEDLVKSHLEATNQPVHRQQVPIELATYFARFDDGQLVDGQAEWVIKGVSNRASMYVVEPCKLAIREMYWSGDDPGKATAGRDTRGRFALAVPRDASLRFVFSLAASERGSAHSVFRFELPRSNLTRLVLQLPAESMPIVPDGIVSRLPASQLGKFLTGVAPSSSADSDLELWLVELGGRHLFDIKIAPRIAGADAATFGQLLAYQITEAGVELRAKLSLNASVPLEQLRLTLDPLLRIAAATVDNQPLRIYEERTRDSVVLDFSPPMPPGERDIDVTALAPLTLGSHVRLPGFRVDNAIWQRGITKVDIPDAFELKGVSTSGYVEAGVEPLPSPQSGESRIFQAFDKNAHLEFSLEYRRPRIDIQTGTTLRMTKASIAARQVSLVTTDSGEQFVLDLLSPPEWVVDSIETIPAEDLESFSTGATQPRRHRVRLRQPISADRPVHLVIRAQRRIPAGDSALKGTDLRPVEFQSVGSERRYVSLLAESPYQLNLLNDAGLNRISPALLSRQMRTLVDWPPGSLLYDDSAKFSSFSVRLNAERRLHSARVEVRATIDGETIHQHYSVQCEPQGGAMTRVQVRVTGLNRPSIDWSIEGDQDSISPRLLPTDGPPNSETWELTLRAPRVAPFTLEGRSRTSFPVSSPIALLSAVEPMSQSASLTIESADGAAFTVRATSLRSIASPDDPKALGATSRAHFRYDPADNSNVSVSRIDHGEPSAAWVWRCQIRSRFDRSGASTHHAELDVENHGSRQTRIRLPQSATIVRASVNGISVPLSNSILLRSSVAVPLPRGERSCRIELEYTSKMRPLGVISSIETPWPLFEIPCLHRVWTAWLPPDYRALAVANRVDRGPSTDLRWDERMFGVKILGPTRASTVDRRQTFGLIENPRVAHLPLGPVEVVSSNTGSGALEIGHGWTNYQVDLDPTQRAALRIVHSPVFDATAWSLVLIAAGAAMCFARRRRRLVYSIGIAAGVTLLVPVGLVPVARGVFLGLLLAAGSMLLRRSSGNRVAGRNPLHHSLKPGLGVLIWCCLAGAVAGQEASSPGPTKDGSADIPVYIPVDDSLRPTGEVVYVPSLLYDFLYGLPSGGMAGVSSLVESASYELQMQRRSNVAELDISRLSAFYDVRVFLPNARISFPFVRDQFSSVDVAIDGRKVSPKWFDDHLEIEIPTVANARVEFLLYPRVVQGDPYSGIRLMVPEVADSKLSVVVPARTEAVTIVGCLGAVTTDTSDLATKVLRADLGPTNEFEVKWVDRARVDADVDVQQVSWLRIQRDTSILDVTYQFSVISGEVNSLRLLADSQLVLQEFGEEQSIVDYSVESGPEQTIDIQLGRTYGASSRFSLRAQFLIPGVVGFGRMEVPRVAVELGNSAENWVAVDLPPGLQPTLSLDSNLTPIPVNTLESVWGPEMPAPSTVYRVNDAARRAAFSIRPQGAESTVNQETILSVGQGFGELYFRAEIDTLSDHVLQHRLRVPPAVQIASVTARQHELNPLLRWSQDDSGTVTVFYSEPPTGRLELELRGTISASVEGQLEVPKLTFPGMIIENDVIHLFRQAEVDLETSGETQRRELIWPPSNVAGRYVGTLISPAGTAVATVRPNAPRINADMTTQLSYDGDTWLVQINVEATPEDGVVDRIRLRIPAEWDDSVEIFPAMPYELESAGLAAKIMTIVPNQAIADTFTLSVQSQLTNPPEQDFQVPDITLLDFANVERFVVVPTTISEQHFKWELNGLEFHSSPTASIKKYRVVGQTMQAILSDITRLAGQQVLLADYYLSWKADGTCHGVAAFDLEPTRRAFCELIMPHDFRLVQATVGGTPAANEALGDQRWQLRLGSDQLSQRIEVLFHGSLPEQNAAHRGQLLVGPTLRDYSIAQTLWTIESPIARNRLWPMLRHTEVEAGEQIEIRLNTIRGLIERAEKDVAGTAPRELVAWRRRWLAVARSQQRMLPVDEPRSEKWVAWVNRFELPGASPPDEMFGGFAARWSSQAQPRGSLYAAVRGDGHEFIVERSSRLIPQTVLTLIGLGLVSIGFAFAQSRYKPLLEWFVRWPHAVGVFIGVLLWLTSSATLAWLVIGLFVLSAVRPYWRYVSAG
jgi:hypothetical protein